jgi:hypothetical protein
VDVEGDGVIGRLGIIPAGGKASRFGGVLKELLPCGEETLLARATRVMDKGAAEHVVLLTSPDRATVHVSATRSLLIASDATLFKSIINAIELQAHWYLFAMPDTYIPIDTFYRKMTSDFMLGVFRTDRPERFGVVNADGRIEDKPQHLAGTNQLAWGALAWSSKVADFWRRNSTAFETHTQAFNMAIEKFGCQAWRMDYYYDMASWADYVELVTNVLPVHG